jgi:hypothetical protein
MVGVTGRLSGTQVLALVKSWLRDGTVVLAQSEEHTGVPVVRGAAVMLVHDGEVVARHMLGRFSGLAATNLGLHLHPHPRAGVPHLPAFAAEAAVGALRALPVLAPPQPLVSGATDLKTLVPKLRDARFSGALVGEGAAVVAVAIMLEGRVAAARASRSGTPLERLDALRALQRLALDAQTTRLALVPLESRSAAALAGFALGHVHAGDPQDHTGVRSDTEGFVFVHRGEAYLTVTGGVAGAAGSFAALEEGSVPDLHLPDEPPGWETQRYVLTLRGRDALNPMTELCVRFRHAFGLPGQRLLEVLAEGAPLEQVATTLETELDELRPWLTRLEAEGLIRVGR